MGRKMSKYMKKGMSIFLVVIMILGTGTTAFAAEYNRNIFVDDMQKTMFIMEGESMDILIPRQGNGRIILDNDDRISIDLPKIVAKEKGILTKKGTVIYDTEGDVSISVQPLQQENGMSFDGLRTLATVKKENTLKEFEYEYNLSSTQKLITAKEYLGEDTGEVFIIDEEKEIIAVIDPSTALDANGKNVESNYIVEGNILTQCVNTNGSTVFPVVASSTTHPSKVSTSYLSKKMTKSYIESMESGTGESIAKGAALIVLGTIPGGAPLATLISVGDLWSLVQKYKVEKIYNDMKSNEYLKITITASWKNRGKNSGYVYGTPKYSKVPESKVPESVLKKIKD